MTAKNPMKKYHFYFIDIILVTRDAFRCYVFIHRFAFVHCSFNRTLLLIFFRSNFPLKPITFFNDYVRYSHCCLMISQCACKTTGKIANGNFYVAKTNKKSTSETSTNERKRSRILL